MSPVSSGQLWSLRDALSRLGYSLRMSPDSSPRIKDGTSESFSGRWPTSATGGPTGFWTLSTSAFPSDAVESTLSDILERQCHQKYSLSPRACLGILRRAAVRGRKLPAPLLRALVTTAIQAPGATEAIPLYPVEVIRYLPKGTAASTTPLKPTSSMHDRTPSPPLTCPFPLMLEPSTPSPNPSELGAESLIPAETKGMLSSSGHPTIELVPSIKVEDQVPAPGTSSKTPEAHDRSDRTGSVSSKEGRATPLMESASTLSVRRLTPTECERLQGLPDGYTCLCKE